MASATCSSVVRLWRKRRPRRWCHDGSVNTAVGYCVEEGDKDERQKPDGYTEEHHDQASISVHVFDSARRKEYSRHVTSSSIGAYQQPRREKRPIQPRTEDSPPHTSPPTVVKPKMLGHTAAFQRPSVGKSCRTVHETGSPCSLKRNIMLYCY